MIKHGDRIAGAKSALAMLTSDTPQDKLTVRKVVNNGANPEKVQLPQRSETSMGLTGKVQLKGKFQSIAVSPRGFP